MGGDTLAVEAVCFPGRGNVVRTGSLGDVMKESVQAALSVVRARAAKLGIDPEIFAKTDWHIHFPEGAVPKDGPSAGAAITTALASAMTGIAVRSDIAMTGEITLRGEVLEIGGLKEKSMAAFREGISTVLIPRDNASDLYEVDAEVKEKADALYEELQKRGVEVIYDDRAVSAGVMFSDADLLGIPLRVIVSPRNLKDGVIEISARDKSFSEKLNPADVRANIRDFTSSETEAV